MEQKTTYMNLQLLRHEMHLDVGADVINENFARLDEKIHLLETMIEKLQHLLDTQQGEKEEAASGN